MSQEPLQGNTRTEERTTQEPTAKALFIGDTRHIIQLNERGDSEFGWDPSSDTETAAARQHFASLRGQGMLMYRVDGDSRDELKEFDPTAARIVAVPASQGG